jgi:hypothetical protein
MKEKKLTEGAKVEIFVASNSSYSCLPSTMLMVPEQIEHIIYFNITKEQVP